MSQSILVAVLRHVAKERGVDLTVDSAGTARYHIGEDPDDRAVANLANQNKVPIQHSARQVTAEDFRAFTHILAADEANLRTLRQRKPHDATAEVRLWGSYLDHKQIDDPYYGGAEGFTECFNQCLQLSHALLDEIIGKADLQLA
ncbi:phosphotyrosine protein phosphatase [Sparassis latifolia]